MKEIILLLCGFVLCHQLYAQTFSEWFRQNHTQLKYLATQIAALQRYDALVQSGYAIEGEELDSIGAIDADELQLHADRIASLDRPNPVLREHELAEGIRQYCYLLPLAAEEIESAFRNLPSLPYDWPNIGIRLREKINRTVQQGKEWLDTTLQDAAYRMDDAGRLRRLNEVFAEMRKTYGDMMFLLGEVDTPGANPLL